MNTARLDALPTSAPSVPAAEPPIQPAAGEDGGPAYRAKVEAAAQQFESFFIAQMLRQMRSATRELAGEDSIYRNRANDDMLDLADTTVANALAGQRAFGIADVILRQMLPAETTPAPAADAGIAAPPFKSRAL